MGISIYQVGVKKKKEKDFKQFKMVPLSSGEEVQN